MGIKKEILVPKLIKAFYLIVGVLSMVVVAISFLGLFDHSKYLINKSGEEINLALFKFGGCAIIALFTLLAIQRKTKVSWFAAIFSFPVIIFFSDFGAFDISGILIDVVIFLPILFLLLKYKNYFFK